MIFRYHWPFCCQKYQEGLLLLSYTLQIIIIFVLLCGTNTYLRICQNPLKPDFHFLHPHCPIVYRKYTQTAFRQTRTIHNTLVMSIIRFTHLPFIHHKGTQLFWFDKIKKPDFIQSPALKLQPSQLNPHPSYLNPSTSAFLPHPSYFEESSSSFLQRETRILTSSSASAKMDSYCFSSKYPFLCSRFIQYKLSLASFNAM